MTKYLRREEAAVLLKVSVRTISRALADGRLTPHKLEGCRSTFIDPNELEGLVRAKVQDQPPPTTKAKA